MLRGYWGVVFAAVGWLILTAASPGGEAGDEERQATQNEIADTLGRIAAALDQANEPKREASDCAPGADDRHSDLCAQWKAADSASKAADYANQAVTIGWWGVALGAITMGAACAAAWFAGTAAKSYIRSERGQLYPALYDNAVQQAEQYGVIKPVLFTVSVSNSGRTAAFLTEVAYITSSKPIYPKEFPEETVLKRSDIINSEKIILAFQCVHYSPPEDSGIYIIGHFKYDDVFGKKHYYPFALRWRSDSLILEAFDIEWPRPY